MGEVLAKCGIVNRAPLKSLKLPALAAREIAVASVEARELVKKSLDFLADASKRQAPVVRAALVKILLW
jgi:hypothetical protein